MTPRERIHAAIRGERSDCVPIDIGGTKVTSLNPKAEAALKELLGLETQLVWGNYRFQRTHFPEGLAQYFEVDVRRVGEDFPDPMPPELTAPVQKDEFGVTWIQTEGGLFMPSVSDPPLADAETAGDLKAYPWPDPTSWQDAETFARKAQKYFSETDYAVSIDLPDCIVQFSQYLRGTERWMIDLVTNKKFASILMGYIADIYTEMLRTVLLAVGNNADLVVIPDDMGGQNGLLISPETYRELIKPLHSKIFETVKQVSTAKIMLHSCGANFPLISDYIDMGVNILNPVQVSAHGMDTRKLAENFGGKICFWGGIDTQYVLPRGKPEEVKDEIKRRIDDFSSGGYVAAPVHVIQAEVPPENILAFIEAAHEYGGRSNGEQFQLPGAKNFFKAK